MQHCTDADPKHTAFLVLRGQSRATRRLQPDAGKRNKGRCTTATHLPSSSCCKRCEQSHHTLSSSVQGRQQCQPALPASAYAPDYDMNSSAARIRGPDETARPLANKDTSIRLAYRVSPIPPLKIGRGEKSPSPLPASYICGRVLMPSTLHQARAPGDAFQIIARPLPSRTAASKKKRGSRQIGIDHADFSSHHHHYQTQGDRDARFHTHPTKAEPRPLIVSMPPHPACRPGRFESRKRPATNPSRLDDMPAPLPRLVVCHTFAPFAKTVASGHV